MNSNQAVFENYILIEDFSNKAGKISFSVYKSECRSWVPFFVYLPPNWSPNKTYPLLLFLHGQGGDESTFNKYVKAEQLNVWINNSEIEPVVIAGVRGDNNREEVQWFTPENEQLIAGDDVGEFIRFCQNNFKAGTRENSISIEGHSRGAAGGIHYYLKYPGRFSSVVAMGYVSSYTLDRFQEMAAQNVSKLRSAKVPLRMEIGTDDSFVRTKNRTCAFELNECLNELELEHEFEVLHGVEHGFDTFWNYFDEEEMQNGLRHLQFHEKSRNNKKE